MRENSKTTTKLEVKQFNLNFSHKTGNTLISANYTFALLI